MTKSNLKSAPEQTAREAASPQLTALDKLKQQAAGKVYADGANANLVGTYEVANAEDPRWSKLFDVLTKQCGKLAKELLLSLDNNDQIVIDADRASEIDELLVHRSTINKVVETYLPLLLGNPWPKARGNAKMREVIGEGEVFSFAMFKRIS